MTDNSIPTFPSISDLFGNAKVNIGSNLQNSSFSNDIQVNPAEFDPTTDIQTPFGTPDIKTDTQQQKYHIYDMYWLINPSLISKKQKDKNCADVCIISYNADFKNLRLSYFSAQNAIQKNCIFLNKMNRIISGTIYPEYAHQLMYKFKMSAAMSDKLFTIQTFERMFQDTGAQWQQNRPVTTIQIANQAVRIIIEDSNTAAYYDFLDWQTDALITACNFCVQNVISNNNA